MKKLFLSVVLFLGIIALLSVYSIQKKPIEYPVEYPVVDQAAVDRIMLGNATISVGVADSDATRIQGLSGRYSLDPDTGLLFIFDTPFRAGIWMKDMNFAIDILWFDSTFKLITVKENATPSSFPTIFYPMSDALYVLEVPSGFVKSHNISIGEKATFSRK